MGSGARLVAAQPGEAHGSAQFPDLGLLLSGDAIPVLPSKVSADYEGPAEFFWSRDAREGIVNSNTICAPRRAGNNEERRGDRVAPAQKRPTNLRQTVALT